MFGLLGEKCFIWVFDYSLNHKTTKKRILLSSSLTVVAVVIAFLFWQGNSPGEERIFTQVKKEFIAALNRSELIDKLRNKQSELDKATSQYTQTRLDTTLELREARDELVNLKFAQQEKRRLHSVGLGSRGGDLARYVRDGFSNLYQ